MRLLNATDTTSQTVGGGNQRAHVLRFQVKSIGATTLTPQKAVPLEDGTTPTWDTCGVRKDTDDTVISSITANGVYSVDVAGCLFRLTASGAAAVVDGAMVVG